MKVSLCTTCFNRLSQLQDTFFPNLSAIIGKSEVEWILLNLNSNDGLHEFIMNLIVSLPPNFIYAKDSASRTWHMAIAKNIVHRLGSGDMLVNLDCDNFIGNTLKIIEQPVNDGVKAIHLWSGTHRDGTCGRIAISRDIFFALGGYDESFYPIGHEELDLLKRVQKSGISTKHIPCAPSSALLNTKKESIKYCNLDKKLTWDKCCAKNRQKSNNNIAKNRLVANQGKKWGSAEIELFRGGSGLCCSILKTNPSNSED